jgi:hypothetical protein
MAIGGGLVMQLWNWLLPPLFGWREVTFWQALGLLVLCRILFGGFGHRGSNHSRLQRRLAERWQQMPPEQRERLRRGLAGAGACGFDAPAGESKTP